MEIFRDYYWLKAELSAFCRDNKISPSGSKKDLQDRIECYLESGVKISKKKNSCSLKKGNKSYGQIALEKPIPENYKNNKNHQEFFKSVIGERFKFNVPFMEWMKSNIGKTYQEAVNQWLRIESDKKSGKKYKIASQFEYNQYTRDFFMDNPSKNRNDAIVCWKYKKGLPGSNKYEFSDLKALNENIITNVTHNTLKKATN